jgi:hypothetical protein
MAVSWRRTLPKKVGFHGNSLGEAAQVHHSVRQYLKELEQQNPVEEPVHEQDQVSTTDPDSTYATKGGTPARLGYEPKTVSNFKQLTRRGWPLEKALSHHGQNAYWSLSCIAVLSRGNNDE